jgi:carboxyl-terminal processing protease
MSVLEVTLLVATALTLLTPLWRRLLKGQQRWLDFLPAGLVVLMVVQVLVDGFHEYMLIPYLLVILLFLFGLRRMIQPDRPVKASRLRTVLTVLSIALGFVILVVGLWLAPFIDHSLGTTEDMSQESWSAAFDEMHKLFSKRYGFGDWKQIDWDGLYAEFAPRIAAAEEAGDQEAYYLALREYAFSIPDGHIGLRGDDTGLWQRSIGGGYGLAVITLDDGTVIAHVLEDGGPADAAGMTWGAQILEWDGVPAQEAIDETSTLWGAMPPATQEGRRLLQENLMTRAPVGTEATVTFQNAGEEVPQTVTLVAVEDGLAPLIESMGARNSAGLVRGTGDEVQKSALRLPPEYEILPEGFGYLRVYHEIPDENDPDFVKIVDEAMAEFTAQNVPGIIIDVRGNEGGMDYMVPQMMGYYFREPAFYEYMQLHNWQTGHRVPDMVLPLLVAPKEPHYAGPIAVLIDPYTKSTGEGFPLVAQQLPQGTVVGVYGTHGSFGMCCAGIKLPGGYELQYPPGQSQDANGRAQLDGDQSLQGGVVPDVRVPLTRETVRAMFVEKEDLVLQYAVDALQTQ